MTNLLFQILTVLVTNVTETTNERYEQIPAPCRCAHRSSMIGCAMWHGWIQGAKIGEATERTVTTTYSRMTNAVCAEPSVPAMLLGSCDLSNRVEVFERQWVAKTNWVAETKPIAVIGYSTNGYPIQWNSNGMFRGQSLIFSNAPVHGNTVSNLAIQTNSYTLELR